MFSRLLLLTKCKDGAIFDQHRFQHARLQSVLAVLPAVLYTNHTPVQTHFGSCPTGCPQNAAVTPEMWDRGRF